MERLILDTSVLVNVERKRVDLSEYLAGADTAIAALTVAEWYSGLYGIAKPRDARIDRHRAFFEGVRARIGVEDYTERVADQHARLLTHTRDTGQPRKAHDLIIAATALTTDRLLLTTDARAGFEDLPGVRAHVLVPAGS